MSKRKKENDLYKPVPPKRYNRKLKLSRNDFKETLFSDESDIQEDIDNEDNASITCSSHMSKSESDTCQENSDSKNEINLKSTGIEENKKADANNPGVLKDDSNYNSETIEKLLEDIRVRYSYEAEEESEMDTEVDISDTSDTEFTDEPEDNEQCSDSDNTEQCHTPLDEPIYCGHSMTVQISLLLILLYSITHGISGSQLSDLLTLIALHGSSSSTTEFVPL